MIMDVLSRKGLTQQDLATLTGRGPRTIQSWVSGESIPELTPEEAVELCDLFGCTIEDLAQLFPGRSKRRAAIRQSHEQKRNAQSS